MRITLACFLLTTLLLTTKASAETYAVPNDFAYTQIHTGYSESGIATQTSVCRVSVSGRKKRSDSFDGSFGIFDMEQGVAMLVNHERKTYSTSGMDKGAYDRFKELTFTDSGTRPKLLQGTVSINGQDAIGYRSVTSGPEGSTTTLTYWISTATNNVIQVESTWSSPNSTVRTIRTEFDYEPKLMEGMFSTIPPQGYAEQPHPEISVSE